MNRGKRFVGSVAVLVLLIFPGICLAQKKIVIRLGDVIAETGSTIQSMRALQKTNGRAYQRSG